MKRSNRICMRAVFVVSLLLTVIASGCGWTQVAKLLPEDGAEGDQFGRSVSISGNRVIVGAMFADENGPDSGSMRIYEKSDSNWELAVMPPLPPDSAGHLFGTSVSISGGRAVVGAIGPFADFCHDGVDHSAAHAFLRFSDGGWAFTDYLVPEYPPDDCPPLGDSVSVSGVTAIVGAYSDDVYGSNSGSAYVFVESDPVGTRWEQWGVKLQPDDGATGDWFGASVSLSGSTAIVGAFHDDDNGRDSGSAYIFHIRETTLPGYTQVAKLYPRDGAEEDYFGYSVSIEGNIAIVGAPWNDDLGINSGSVYIFQNSGSGWEQVEKLLPDDGAEGDEFGISVSISGDIVIIGAFHDDDKGHNSGSAYIFQNNGSGWTQIAKLLASDGEGGEEFGVSVSISDLTAIVGAPRDNDNGRDSGSAYIFTRIDR